MSDEIQKIKEDLDVSYRKFMMCFGKRRNQFGIDRASELQDEIDSLIDDCYQIIDKIESRIRKVIFILTGKPRRLTIRNAVTVREGTVYKYDDSHKASLSDILGSGNNILNNISSDKKRIKLREILNFSKRVYAQFRGIKFMKNQLKAREVKTEDVEIYIKEVSHRKILIYRNGFIIKRLRFANKSKAIQKCRRGDRIDLGELDPQTILDYGDIKMDDIISFLEELSERLDKDLSNLIKTKNKLEKKFSSELMSVEI